MVSTGDGFEEYRVWSVYVHSTHRRQGIATALYDEAVASLGPIAHSDVVTDSGRAWREFIRGRRNEENRTRQGEGGKVPRIRGGARGRVAAAEQLPMRDVSQLPAASE